MTTGTGSRDGYILIGTIGRAHGLGGHVRVRPFTDDPERFYDLGRALVEADGKLKPYDVDGADVAGDSVTLHFAGVTDRTAAEALNGLSIYVPREEAVELPPGAYFINDLVGCSVEDESGRFLGKLAEVLQHGAADVYVLRGGPGGEVMFPALKAVISDTDVKSKKITVRAERFKEVAVFED